MYGENQSRLDFNPRWIPGLELERMTSAARWRPDSVLAFLIGDFVLGEEIRIEQKALGV